MTRSPNPEQRLLAEIRRALSPTAADEARIRTGLVAELGAGVLHAPSLDSSLPTADAAGELVANGLRGLGRQLIAAGLIGAAGFGTGYAVGNSTGSPLDPPPPPPLMAASAAPASSQASLELDPEPPATERSQPLPAASASPPEPAASGPSLEQEASELRRVGRALRDHEPLLALKILDDLDEQIPKGALGEERAAARLMARCQKGDVAAHAEARLWITRHPRSVYAPRLRSSCTAAEEPAPPDSDEDEERSP